MNEWMKKIFQYTLIVLYWWIYVLKRFTVLESVVNNGFSITFEYFMWNLYKILHHSKSLHFVLFLATPYPTVTLPKFWIHGMNKQMRAHALLGANSFITIITKASYQTISRASAHNTITLAIIFRMLYDINW